MKRRNANTSGRHGPGPSERLLLGAAAALTLLLLSSVGSAAAQESRWDKFWGIKRNSPKQPLFGKRTGDAEVWTVECNEYRGAGARELADNMATALKRVRELRDRQVWVQHEDDRSRIFCGEYPLRYGAPPKRGTGSQAPSEPEIELTDAIKHDLEFVRGLAIDQRYPFFSARPIPKPVADVGPPEWDLRNTRGAYTLNVGVTYSTATLHDYKDAAVQWVTDLRRRGYQAYYYHDPVKPRSSVCVGTFGEDALIVSPDGHRRYSDAVNALRDKEELHWNLENGARTFRSATGPDGKHVRMPNESFLVKIPQKGNPLPTASKRR